MTSFHKYLVFTSLFLALSQISLGQQLQHPVAISSNSGSMISRAPDSRAWSDPALNHNKLLQQQTGEGVYKLIGPYKVIGTSFLFGEHHKGDMFATEAKAYNIFISYNTYNQEVEFYSSSNPDKPLVKEPGTVDSFTIHENIELGITKPLKFVYGPVLGVKEKYYYQEVCPGDRYVLYKRYKSDLDYVSSNLGQSELRQFDLQYEYYYFDRENKDLKKLKPNASSIIKEFKSVKDLSVDINTDEFSSNPEIAMCKAFAILNKPLKGF